MLHIWTITLSTELLFIEAHFRGLMTEFVSLYISYWEAGVLVTPVSCLSDLWCQTDKTYQWEVKGTRFTRTSLCLLDKSSTIVLCEGFYKQDNYTVTACIPIRILKVGGRAKISYHDFTVLSWFFCHVGFTTLSEQ